MDGTRAGPGGSVCGSRGAWEHCIRLKTRRGGISECAAHDQAVLKEVMRARGGMRLLSGSTSGRGCVCDTRRPRVLARQGVCVVRCGVLLVARRPRRSVPSRSHAAVGTGGGGLVRLHRSVGALLARGRQVAAQHAGGEGEGDSADAEQAGDGDGVRARDHA